MASAATELLSPQGCEPSLAIGLDHDQQYDDLGYQGDILVWGTDWLCTSTMK